MTAAAQKAVVIGLLLACAWASACCTHGPTSPTPVRQSREEAARLAHAEFAGAGYASAAYEAFLFDRDAHPQMWYVVFEPRAGEHASIPGSMPLLIWEDELGLCIASSADPASAAGWTLGEAAAAARNEFRKARGDPEKYSMSLTPSSREQDSWFTGFDFELLELPRLRTLGGESGAGVTIDRRAKTAHSWWYD